MNTSRLGLQLFWDRLKMTLGADYSVYKNVLYFDSLARAAQYNGQVQVFHAFFQKNIHLFNWHLDNKVTFQQAPGSSVIRLPQWVLEEALYYENTFFKKVARLQVGLNLFYVSAYYANAYMPATGQFYLQDKVKTGNYPALNFFINAQVKSVRVFFKIDHLNANLTPGVYALTPYNPMNGRAFKFGASWLFFV